MPVSRRTLALLAATLLAGGAAPAVAPAQTVPAPEELPPLQQLPDTEEPASPEPQPAEERQEQPASGSSSERPRATELADTGSDPRVVALLGFTALLTGVGLRLRTAPERF